MESDALRSTHRRQSARVSRDGIAIANLDDELAAAQARRCAGKVIEYSCTARGDVRAQDVHLYDEGAHGFELATPQGKASVRVTGLGTRSCAFISLSDSGSSIRTVVD